VTVRTITGTSGKDPIEGTAGSDKINADAGNDVLFYNLADSLLPATQDVYSGNGGIDMVVLRFSYSQWMDLENQAQLTRYFNWRSTVKTDSAGQISNGKDSDFTFKFGASTLKIQMMEQLGVMVDGNFLGGPFSVYGRRPPVANDDTVSLSEDDGPVTIDVLNSIRPGESDLVPDLLRSLDLASGYGPAHGTVTLQKNSANPADWKFIYTVDTAYYQSLSQDTSASDSFRYQITDANGLTALATVKITIKGLNDPAHISGQSAYELTEDLNPDSANQLQVSGQLFVSDADAGENEFTTVVTAASGTIGTLSLQSDGRFTYSINNADVQYLDNGDERKEVFTVASADGSATKELTFTIHGVADDIAPEANPDVIWVTDNAHVRLATRILLANDTDADSDPDDLKIISFSAAPDMSLVPVLTKDAQTGEDYFSFDASAIDDDEVDFNYVVADEAGLTHEGTVTVKVQALNDAENNALSLQGESYDGAYLVGDSTVTHITAGGGPSVLVGDPAAASVLQGDESADVLLVGDDLKIPYVIDLTSTAEGQDSAVALADNCDKVVLKMNGNSLAGGTAGDSSQALAADDQLSIGRSLDVTVSSKAVAYAAAGTARAISAFSLTQQISDNQLFGDLTNLENEAVGGADTLGVGVGMYLGISSIASAATGTESKPVALAVSKPTLGVELLANRMHGDAETIVAGSQGGNDVLTLCDSVDIVADAQSLAFRNFEGGTADAQAGPNFRLIIKANDLYGDAESMDGSSAGEDSLSLANYLSIKSTGEKVWPKSDKTILEIIVSSNNLYGDAKSMTQSQGDDDVLKICRDWHYEGTDSTMLSLTLVDNRLYGDAYTMSGSTGGNDVLLGADIVGSTTYLTGDSCESDADSVGGNDRLISGAGNDHMWGDFGGKGNTLPADHGEFGKDVFSFSGFIGDDVIYDFHLGEDLIEFAGPMGGLQFGDLASGIFSIDDGANTYILLGDFGGITLIGIQSDQLTAADFLFSP